MGLDWGPAPEPGWDTGVKFNVTIAIASIETSVSDGGGFSNISFGPGGGFGLRIEKYATYTSPELSQPIIDEDQSFTHALSVAIARYFGSSWR